MVFVRIIVIFVPAAEKAFANSFNIFFVIFSISVEKGINNDDVKQEKEVIIEILQFFELHISKFFTTKKNQYFSWFC